MELEARSLQLIGAYRSIYTRLVRPDVALPVRHYFLKHWAPRLGGDITLLIIQLRRLCLAQGGEPVELSGEQLAGLVGISERTLRRLLADPRVEPFVERQHQWRYDPKVGHGVQTHNRYIVALDDPLIEEHEQLAADLAQDTEATLGPGNAAGAGTYHLVADRPAPAVPAAGSNGNGPASPARPPSRQRDVPGGSTASRARPDEYSASTRPADDPVAKPSFPVPAPPDDDSGPEKAGQRDRLEQLNRLAGQVGPHTSDRPGADSHTSSVPVKVADTIRRIGFDKESIPTQSKNRGHEWQQTGKRTTDILVKRPDWQERIEQAEHVLHETGASRGFYIKVLRTLEAQDAINVWDRALGLVREQDPSTIRRSRGALFNTLVRRFAAEVGVTL